MRKREQGQISQAGRKAERGQNVVEFAMSAFLFFLLVAIVIDIGRAVWYDNTLQQAVRTATRYAIVHGSKSASPIGPGDGQYVAGPPSSDSAITTQVDKNIIGFSSAMVVVT